jgi:hypothetical protein
VKYDVSFKLVKSSGYPLRGTLTVEAADELNAAAKARGEFAYVSHFTVTGVAPVAALVPVPESLPGIFPPQPGDLWRNRVTGVHYVGGVNGNLHPNSVYASWMPVREVYLNKPDLTLLFRPS